MSIPVDCPGCQAHYEAPDKFAGQRMKCKACGAVLTVPLPELEPIEDVEEAAAPVGVARLDDMLDSGGSSGDESKLGATCPACRAAMNPGDILCLDCGYNIEKKKSMKPKERESAGGHRGVRKPGAKKKTPEVVAARSSSRGRGIDVQAILVMILFVIDILACLVQVGQGLQGMNALSAVRGNAQVPMQLHILVYLSLGIGIVGIPANALMLCRQIWAVGLAYFALALTAASILLDAMLKMQIYNKISEAASKGMHMNSQTGAYVAGAIVGAVVGRGLYAALYAAAVNNYNESAGGGNS